MDLLGPLLHVLLWYGLPLLAIGSIFLLLIEGARFVAKRVDPSPSNHRSTAITGCFIGTFIALGAGSIPLLDDGSLSSDWLRGVAFISILMLPALLAIVGLQRPGALLVAGVVSLPMPFMSFSLLLFPMLIPAAFYLVAYGRATTKYTPRVPPAAVAGLTLLLIVLSLLSLFMNQDPYCYEIVKRPDGSTFERPVPSTERVGTIEEGSSFSASFSGPGSPVVGSGCSSDSVTPIEAGLSLGLVALAGIAAAYLSGPRRSDAGALDVYA